MKWPRAGCGKISLSAKCSSSFCASLEGLPGGYSRAYRPFHGKDGLNQWPKSKNIFCGSFSGLTELRLAGKCPRTPERHRRILIMAPGDDSTPISSDAVPNEINQFGPNSQLYAIKWTFRAVSSRGSGNFEREYLESQVAGLAEISPELPRLLAWSARPCTETKVTWCTIG